MKAMKELQRCVEDGVTKKGGGATEEEEGEGAAEGEAGRDGRKGKVLSPEKMQAKILKRPRVKRGVVNCASALTGGRKRKEKE